MLFVKQKEQKKDLLTDNVRNLFVGFLIPNTIAMLSASITFFVDTYALGQGVGEFGLTVAGLAAPISGVFYALGSMMGVGGGALFSVYNGANEKRRAQGTFTASFLFLLFVVALFTIPSLFFVRNIAMFLGASGNVLDMTTRYARMILVFAPFYSIEQFLGPFLRNDNAERWSMSGSLIGAIVNCVLDILFLIVFGWETHTIAIAIGISLVVIVVVDSFAFFRKDNTLRFVLHPDMGWDLWKSIIIGIPSLISEARASIIALAANWTLLKVSSETAVAVYGVITNITSIVVLVMMGTTTSLQPIVSANFGASKHNRSNQALKYSLYYSFIISFIFLIAGVFFTRQIINIFIDADDHFMSLAIPAIRITFISFVLKNVSLQLTTFLQAMSANKEALYLSIMRSLILPVLAIVVMGLWLGTNGVWLSAIVAEGIGMIACIYVVHNIDKEKLEREFRADVEI